MTEYEVYGTIDSVLVEDEDDQALLLQDRARDDPKLTHAGTHTPDLSYAQEPSPLLETTQDPSAPSLPHGW